MTSQSLARTTVLNAGIIVIGSHPLYRFDQVITSNLLIQSNLANHDREGLRGCPGGLCSGARSAPTTRTPMDFALDSSRDHHSSSLHSLRHQAFRVTPLRRSVACCLGSGC